MPLTESLIVRLLSPRVVRKVLADGARWVDENCIRTGGGIRSEGRVRRYMERLGGWDAYSELHRQ